MQQYQVSRRAPSCSQPSKQYQTRSPFNSIENTQKSFHHKASTDFDIIQKQSSNPYCNQFLKRSSNSNHDKPPVIIPQNQSLQFSNSKQSLHQNQSHDYSIQFKVGKNEQSKMRKTDQTNETQLSQLINPPKQYPCMSPINHQRGSTCIYLSPKNDPNAMQSPPYNLVNTPLYYNKYGSASQLKIPQSTNINSVQQELNKLLEQNSQINYKIQQIESEINRGQSSQFIQELENKISMLNQLNYQLKTENDEIQEKINKPFLQDKINQQKQQKEILNVQLHSFQQQIKEGDQNCQELIRKIEDKDDSRLKELVNELENKVSGLILENDRLNKQLNTKSNLQQIVEIQKSKNQIEQLGKQLQQLKRDEEHLKQTYNQLEEAYNQQLSDNIYADLYEKIQLLIEENERLQQVISDTEYTDQDLNDLKERVRVIKADNKRMELKLKK